MSQDGIPFLVRSGRNPFEILLLVACFAAGVVGFFQPQSSSGAINAALPYWQALCWYIGLTGGGLMGLIGVFNRGVNSLLMERVGVVMLTCFTFGYSAAVISQVGFRGIFPAVFTGFFAVACAVRSVYITVDLKNMEKIAAKHVDGDK